MNKSKNMALVIIGSLLTFSGRFVPRYIFPAFFSGYNVIIGLLIAIMGLRPNHSSRKEGIVGIIVSIYWVYISIRNIMNVMRYFNGAFNIQVIGIAILSAIMLVLSITALKKKKEVPVAPPQVDKNQQLITYCSTLYNIDITKHKLFCVIDCGIKELGPVCVCDDGYIYFYREVNIFELAGEMTKLAISSVKEVVVLSNGTTTFRMGENEISRKGTSFLFNTHDGQQFKCNIFEDSDNSGYPVTMDFVNTLRGVGLPVDISKLN